MKRVAFVWGVMALAMAGCTTPPGRSSRPPAMGDLDRLQGTWELIYAEEDGVKTTPPAGAGATLTIAGQEFAFRTGMNAGAAQRGTFRLSPNTQPKAIDAISSEGMVSQGIYAIEGEYHLVCFASPGQPRPPTFASPKGSRYNVQIWRRLLQ